MPLSDLREPSPAVWPIVRRALTNSNPAVKRLVRMIAVFWVLMVALQIWDSRNSEGAAGVAEFLSAALGICGIGLLGIAAALQLSMEDVAGVQPSGDSAGVARVLLALPVVGFTAGVALGSATVLMVVRGVLGAEIPLVVAGVLVNGVMTVIAARTVTRSTQTLFQFAARQARTAADHRAAATTARLDALQARMNPHVLFNALNTVASLVRSNPPAAERVVETLADVLRQTLNRSSDTQGTVADEITYVRACLALEQERHGNHLRVSWNVDESVMHWPLPPFVIQPLVENALRHGLGSRLDGGHIQIGITPRGDQLSVTVEDDGIGFQRNWREGQGLGNLRQRLSTMFGSRASLNVDANRSGSALVTVRLPGREADDESPDR